MKINLVGPSYQARSLPFNAQRTVNLFPVFDEQGKETAALYGTPGLELFATVDEGSIRGCFRSATNRAFIVSGNKFYEINALGEITEHGLLDTSAGPVTFDENVTQIGVCDGKNLYIFHLSSNDFEKITDADLPESKTLAVIDSYFIINKDNSGEFYISAVADGASWNALDFATAESFPDNLLRVIRVAGQLWLFGENTTEIWTNTGASPFPFERIAGSIIDKGIAAPHSALEIDNTVYWLGRSPNGAGSVYRARGFTPERISTQAIDYALQNAGDHSNIRAWSYRQDGHVFYVLTGSNLETSFVYDVTTGLWHERAYLNAEGQYEPHRGCCHMEAFGKHLVGDRENGTIYVLSLDHYTDNGQEILRERIYTHLSDENKRVRFNSLEIGVETGVGSQFGQGSDPSVSLQVSKDGARTWSDECTVSIGKSGEYQKKVQFRQLGVAEQMTFRIKISDPVKVAITGSYLR